MRIRKERLRASFVFRDRNCTFTLTLDKRTNKKDITAYPLSVRFTINRRSIYHHIGGNYTPANFDKIRDAKEDDQDWSVRQQWVEFMSQYERVLQTINVGHALTLEDIKDNL